MDRRLRLSPEITEEGLIVPDTGLRKLPWLFGLDSLDAKVPSKLPTVSGDVGEDGISLRGGMG